MFMEERQREIAAHIQANGKITTAEITQTYGISDESARRDLRILEQNGLCKRTHGGAIALQQVSVRPAVDRDYASMSVFPTYREIAKRAVGSIREGDIVYLTGGSFGYIMLTYLPRDIRYTLVINNVDLAQRLRAFDNVEVYLAGGKMRQSGTVVDSLARTFVGQLHFDLCFLTGAGLTADFGLSNGTDETASFQRTVLQNSRRKILLLPGTKIGVDSFIRVCSADAFDTLITDWDCAEDQIAALEDAGLEVVVVDEAP